MKKGIIYLLLGSLLSFFQSTAQVNVRDSAVEGFIFNINLGGYLPSGDVANRFGANMSLGADAFYKTRSNWLIGPGFTYLFGDQVYDIDELFSDLVTGGGDVIGGNGDYATIDVFERGYTLSMKAGKIIPLFGPNPNSGLLVQFGAGYLQHKIQIDVLGNSVPQLNEEYLKGYDHKHGGLMLNQYVAFYHSGNRRLRNFTVGLDFMQAFTKNLREYNYDTRSFDLEDKVDLFFGIKVSWYLPIYNNNAQKFYYN